MLARWRDFDDADGALRYLRVAVVNRSRSALRHRRRWRDLILPHAREVTDAEEEAFQRVGNALMQRAVAALPHRQREVVVLRYYEDLPVAEVERVQRISQGAVKSSTNRALASLDALMQSLP